MSTPGTRAERAVFKFQDLEIPRNALVMRLFDEETSIPLKEIASYDLKWHLHDPIFAKKYWFLELTVVLNNGEEQSGAVAIVKFNYLNDEDKPRRHIESKISHAINLALSRRGAARLRKK